ncbi:MAG: sugar phosphate isomerase/epimerase [Tannerella sp.]|jgi:inosose dehydratase|nr:sugar phosphate isomerase/epimerase [Tannerella sp.]
MNRRTFLHNATFGLPAIFAVMEAVSCSATKSAAGTKNTNIRWSMGWILWRDFKKKQIPLREAIDNLSALGLDGIEFSPRKDELQKHDFTRESFRDFIKDKNIAVSGNYFGGDYYDPAKKNAIMTSFRSTIDNLKFYGSKNVVIGPPGRNVEDIKDCVIKSAPMLNEMGRIAREEGITIGVHPHVNTIIEAPDEIDLIMELTDPQYVGMAPDTGHIRLGGGNVVEIVNKYRDRLCYFHFKDSDGEFKRPDFAPNLRELGKGVIDFPAVMKILKNVSFKGWLNVEQDYTTTTPLESATVSAGYIHNVLKKIL